MKVEALIPGVHKLLIQSGEGSFSQDPRLPFTPANLYLGANGKTTVLNLPTEWSRELGLALGWLIGDGWLRSGDKNCRVGFTFAKSDAPVFATLRPILNRWYGRNIRGVKRANGVYHLSYHSKFFVEFFEHLGVTSVDSADKEAATPAESRNSLQDSEPESGTAHVRVPLHHDVRPPQGIRIRWDSLRVGNLRRGKVSFPRACRVPRRERGSSLDAPCFPSPSIRVLRPTGVSGIRRRTGRIRYHRVAVPFMHRERDRDTKLRGTTALALRVL